MGQEAHNPQRTVPLALLLGLGICAVLYLAVSFVVTGLVGYRDLGVPDPMFLALDRAGPSVLWAKYLVGFVAVVGLVSVLLVTLMGQVRIFYAMGRDGLLPAAFARVHPITRTPHVGTIVTGVVSCIAAGILPLGVLGDIISMGGGGGGGAVATAKIFCAGPGRICRGRFAHPVGSGCRWPAHCAVRASWPPCRAWPGWALWSGW